MNMEMHKLSQNFSHTKLLSKLLKLQRKTQAISELPVWLVNSNTV